MTDSRLQVTRGGTCLLDADMGELIGAWGETSWRIQRERDNPDSADQEYAVTKDGQRFLVNRPQSVASATPLTVIVNWTSTLQK